MKYKPSENARQNIAKIEKRFKSTRNRIDKVNSEAIFWLEFWQALGLMDEPDYQDALKVYSDYANSGGIQP